MFKKILSFFYTDLQWKLLSLVLALILWFISTSVNNPFENRPLDRALQLHNLGIMNTEGIAVLNIDELRNTTIQIGIRGPRQDIEALAFIEDMLIASIDFRAVNRDYIYAADGAVIIELDVSANLAQMGFANVNHQYIRPHVVNVELDLLTQKSFYIQTIVDGEVADGFELQNIVLTNQNVNIEGPRSYIALIESVYAYINIANLSDNTPMPSRLIVYDSDGRDITGFFNLSVSEIIANIHILPVESVALAVNIIGTPAQGFVVHSFYTDPLYINIIDTLNISQDYITVEVDITDLEEDDEYIIDIQEFLPAGIHLSESEPAYIRVFVYIEPIERRIFSIPRADIAVFAHAAVYQLLGAPLPVRIVVEGPQSIVSLLSGADINVSLNLAGRGIGDHRAAVTVSLPDGVYLAEAPPFLDVRIHDMRPPPIEPPDEPTIPPVEPEPPDDDPDEPDDEPYEPDEPDETYEDDYNNYEGYY